MAGIYIHIPFCKKRCLYCDFYSSTSLNIKERLLAALIKEADIRSDYLKEETIETIYIGGGTPSLLSPDELKMIFDGLYSGFIISEDAEITFEANPDDLTAFYLKQIKQTPVNRLSIGIQSFFNKDLKLMDRRHDKEQATDSVKFSRDAGFENVSIDLIYGLPGQTITMWEQNLNRAFGLGIKHLSAYHLGFEPGTVFYELLRKGEIERPGQEESYEQYKLLVEQAADSGFMHYEISNFGKEGYLSKHNTNYWLQKKYLGLGPSAHSYNTISRQWNIADNLKYTESIEKNVVPCEHEHLDDIKKYNEYIMVSLRTMWGCDLKYIETGFGKERAGHCLNNIQKYINTGKAYIEKDNIFLTTEGKFISDKMISDLFFIEG